MDRDTNRARYAGSWYPADSDELTALLARVAPASPAAGDLLRPRMAVLPHAGLIYSGRGQEAFWERRAPECGGIRIGPDAASGVVPDVIPEVIVILAPSHSVPVAPDTTLGAPFAAYQAADRTLPGLTLCLGDRENREALENEHALELLLPAMAVHRLEQPIGALLAGPFRTPGAVRAAARRILDRLEGAGIDPARVLWLVSSDFTHYGPRFGFLPFGRGAYGQVGPAVAQADREVAEAAALGGLERFWKAMGRESTVCGRFAISLALALLEATTGAPAVETVDGRGGEAGRVLSYYTSADLARNPGSEENFVCYATVEITTV